EGADIIAVDLCAPIDTIKYAGATSADLAETVRQVTAIGREIVAAEADVRHLAGLQKAVAEGVGSLGSLDVIVANAGVMSAGRLWELTEEQWRDVIDINLTGVWHTIKATVPTMIEQGTGGSIILTSSVAGLVGQPFVGHYVSSKHGVVGLCRTLANELGEYNIRVNSIHPVGVNTDMLHDPDLFPMITERQDTLGPLFMNTLPFDFLEPEDVAGLVAFLASDEAKYMTGAQVPIDLGVVNR
ncbi:MAG TPA: mycofactocin-coupled SDR family oxidoreductase, partial [Acidimicrobiales bacterium]|nr:mycofactocin-coupled SDR family oxidoreductase [Acidimicrobiales bacterium]